MNKQNPPDSNPLPNDAGPNQADEEQSQTSNQRRQTRSRRSRRMKSAGYKARFKALKVELQARLGGLDDTRLKRILIACGIAAVLVVAIVALIKSIPVGLAILSIVGLAVVVRFLEELRRLPILNTL